MQNEFQDKVVVITGASSGIGKATAKLFAAKGAKVMLLDIDSNAGEAIKADLISKQYSVEFYTCDVTDEHQTEQTLMQIVTRFGAIDHCYNNAGVGGEFAITHEYPTDDFDHVMKVNTKSVFLCMKHQLRHMVPGRRGTIVNCASVLSQVAYKYDIAYVASKFAVVGLTKNAALEYAPYGIRINSISPGFTKTPMVLKATEEKLDLLASQHAAGRLAEPNEIASAVLWLCSSESSFVIGSNLIIDGGYTLS